MAIKKIKKHILTGTSGTVKTALHKAVYLARHDELVNIRHKPMLDRAQT